MEYLPKGPFAGDDSISGHGFSIVAQIMREERTKEKKVPNGFPWVGLSRWCRTLNAYHLD